MLILKDKIGISAFTKIILSKYIRDDCTLSKISNDFKTLTKKETANCHFLENN